MAKLPVFHHIPFVLNKNIHLDGAIDIKFNIASETRL
jgi:hypothetical protein